MGGEVFPAPRAQREGWGRGGSPERRARRGQIQSVRPAYPFSRRPTAEVKRVGVVGMGGGDGGGGGQVVPAPRAQREEGGGGGLAERGGGCRASLGSLFATEPGYELHVQDRKTVLQSQGQRQPGVRAATHTRCTQHILCLCPLPLLGCLEIIAPGLGLGGGYEGSSTCVGCLSCVCSGRGAYLLRNLPLIPPRQAVDRALLLCYWRLLTHRHPGPALPPCARHRSSPASR
jgi:hypothetical protein